MGDTTVDVTGRVVSDIIILGLLVSLIALFESGAVTPVENGFFCNDQSIQYPWRPDTVNFYLLLVAGLLVPFFTICVVELPHYISSKRAGEESSTSCCGLRVGLYWVQVYRALAPFLVAAALDLLVVCVFKYSMGRLRPCFLAICNPDLTAETCMQDGHYKYVTTPQSCMDPHLLSSEARMSFPSGHTSHAVVCCLYFMLYIERRMTWGWSRLPRHVLQVAALCLPCYVGSSRINDYKHHPTDVLGGAVIGLTVTVIIVYFFSNLFQRTKDDENRQNIRRTDYDRIK